jgi:CRISPR-associated protein Cmr3
MTTPITKQHSYLIEPLAPLVFRSGKPFGPQSGADNALFPLPSSLAGLLRTVLADQQHNGQPFSDTLTTTLRKTATRGPLLARYGANNTEPQLLIAKPADALYVDENGETAVVRLSPKKLDDDCGCDLRTDLLPVQMEKENLGKPKSGPQYWSMTDFIQWQAGQKMEFETLQGNGLDSLPNEQRTHVAIDSKTFASEDGKLFQTSGLDLGHKQMSRCYLATTSATHTAWQDQRLGFWAQSEAQLKNDLVTFGGERRLSQLMAWPTTTSDPTHCNIQLAAEVRAAKGIKLTLLSPAIFAGWLSACMVGQK